MAPGPRGRYLGLGNVVAGAEQLPLGEARKVVLLRFLHGHVGATPAGSSVASAAEVDLFAAPGLLPFLAERFKLLSQLVPSAIFSFLFGEVLRASTKLRLAARTCALGWWAGLRLRVVGAGRGAPARARARHAAPPLGRPGRRPRRGLAIVGGRQRVRGFRRRRAESFLPPRVGVQIRAQLLPLGVLDTAMDLFAAVRRFYHRRKREGGRLEPRLTRVARATRCGRGRK